MLRRLYRLMNYRKPRELSRKFCTRIGEICDSKFEWICYLISLQTQYETRDEIRTKYLVLNLRYIYDRILFHIVSLIFKL